MKRATQGVCIAALLLCVGAGAAAWHSDWSGAPLDKTPDDVAVLNGQFALKEVDGKRCLELSAEPLDTFGLLFGPAEAKAGDTTASIWADVSGRRFPEFGIGAEDAGGIRLWAMPGQHALELRQGDDVIARVEGFDWKPGTWTRLRLSVVASGSAWKAMGRVWPASQPEPRDWQIKSDVSEPPGGRSSAWGIPYSGKPIRFRELGFEPVR